MPIPRSVATQIAKVQAISDPAERGRAAGKLLADLGEATLAVSEVREAAVRELVDGGATLRGVAAALGVSRTRGQQLANPSRYSRHKAQRVYSSESPSE